MFYPFELERYLEELLPPRDELLLEMERTALKETIPVVTPAVGHFLGLLIQCCKASRILEIGTAIGYSTIYLARAAQRTGGRVLTVDMNRGRMERAVEYIRRAGLDKFVEFRLENALKFLPGLEEEFDFIFVDGAKGEYPDYLDLLCPLVCPGGLLVVDNVLFRGWVVPGSIYDKKYDRMVNRMREFLKRLSGLKGFTTSILPLGDGVAVSRKNGEKCDQVKGIKM